MFGCERDPLPGSDPARHLEPDALIIAAFGALRSQLSRKMYFFQNSISVSDPTCSGAAMFVVILAGPQKEVSRLDGTQNFASRADGRLGFEGKVPKVREGCLRQGWPSRDNSEGVNPILFHI